MTIFQRLALILALLLPAQSFADGIQNGGGTSSGGGAVSSVTGSCGVTVSPTTGATIASANVTQRNNTATTDTLVTGDCGTVVTESNASAVAVAIAQAGSTGFASGYYVTVKNKGAGTVTITPTTSTIDGSATLTLAQNASVDIYSDGTNYITLPGRSTGGTGTITAGTTPTSGITSGHLIGSSSNLVVDAGSPLTAFGLVPYVAGNYYYPWGIGTTATSGAIAANTMRCYIAYFKGLATVDTIGVRVVVVSSGGNTQVAIYAVSNGLPTGLPLATTASISTTTAANVAGTVNSGTPVQLGSPTAAVTPYAFCFNNDTTAGATATFNATQQGWINLGSEVGAASANNLANAGGNSFSSWTLAQTFGTWPTLTSAALVPQPFQAPMPQLHMSSVP